MASLPENLALAVQRVLRSSGPLQVHDLRVAIRRFRQAVALDPQNRTQSQWKAVLKRAGDVRNVDITIKLIGKMDGTKGLQSKLKRSRAKAAAELKRQLTAGPLPYKIPESTAATARRAAIRAITRLFDRGAKARQPKDLHKLRIAAKKLRYTLELVAPHHPRIEEIKRLQSDLGRINDYETARTLVKLESGPESVRDQLKDKQRKKIRAFRSRWTGILQDHAVPRTWIRELSAA